MNSDRDTGLEQLFAAKKQLPRSPEFVSQVTFAIGRERRASRRTGAGLLAGAACLVVVAAPSVADLLVRVGSEASLAIANVLVSLI